MAWRRSQLTCYRVLTFFFASMITAAPGATPAVVGNSFSTATGDAEASESAIWVVAQSGDVSVRWVNPDGCQCRFTRLFILSRLIGHDKF